MKATAVVLIGFTPNHRILRRMEVESQIYDTHLICWDRGKNMIPTGNSAGYVSHVISITAGTDPIKRLIPTMKFAEKATAIISKLKPILIHVQGLDMLKIAVDYKRKANHTVHIIYEVADLHRYIVDEQHDLLRRLVRRYLIYQDRHLQKYYDALIVTSEAYYNTYFKDFVPNEKVLYIPNMPDFSIYDNYHKKTEGEFVVGFIGAIRYKKQIYNLIKAAKQANVKILMAGYEKEPIEIEPICRNDDQIEWVGAFDYKTMAAKLYEKCDVMYSVYDADMANVRVALPNKLYEAVYCEMPIIVAKRTYLAELVDKWSVGIAVDHNSTLELQQAICSLRDNRNLVNEIVHNCRRVSEHFIDSDNANDRLREKLLRLIAKE